MPNELEYKIEQWDTAEDRVKRLIAAADTLRVARAAFETAVALYPRERIMLRQRARVIDDSATR